MSHLNLVLPTFGLLLLLTGIYQLLGITVAFMQDLSAISSDTHPAKLAVYGLFLLVLVVILCVLGLATLALGIFLVSILAS